MNSPTPDTVVVMTAEMAALLDSVMFDYLKDAERRPKEEIVQAIVALHAIASKQVACYNTATHEVVSKDELARLRRLDSAQGGICNAQAMEAIAIERDSLRAKLAYERRALGNVLKELSRAKDWNIKSDNDELTALRTRLVAAEAKAAAWDAMKAEGPVLTRHTWPNGGTTNTYPHQSVTGAVSSVGLYALVEPPQ